MKIRPQKNVFILTPTARSCFGLQGFLSLHACMINSFRKPNISIIHSDWWLWGCYQSGANSISPYKTINIHSFNKGKPRYVFQSRFISEFVSIYVHVHLSFSLLILTFILLWFCFSLSFSFNFALSVSSWETGSSPIKFSSVFSISVTFTVCNCPLHWKIFYRKVFYFLSTKKNLTYISFCHESNM